MKRVVLDASVIVKWVLWDKDEEPHVRQALELLQAVMDNQVIVLQPLHWLAEVAGAVSRLRPQIALESINALYAMSFKVADSLEIYKTACKLSSDFNHHIFDTLYHAVAMCHSNTQLITADDHYYRKVSKQGNIISLADFSV